MVKKIKPFNKSSPWLGFITRDLSLLSKSYLISKLKNRVVLFAVFPSFFLFFLVVISLSRIEIYFATLDVYATRTIFIHSGCLLDENKQLNWSKERPLF